MRLIKKETTINFLGKRLIFVGISITLLLIGLIAFFVKGGLVFGIDFKGGTIVQVQFEKPQEIKQLRETMNQGNLGPFSLQSFGDTTENEFLITLSETSSGISNKDKKSLAEEAVNLLKEQYAPVKMRRVESVGPKVGEELKTKALEAILFSLCAILIYIWFRFHWRYSLGAIMALSHDILLVLAAFVITGKEINLPVVAAILTVAGYSINDTIVIFDRIRENTLKFQKKALIDVFNKSINQTLTRTLLTSGTTLFVVLSLFLFGGEIINDFAFALLLGVLVGTYSSIFIATPVVFSLNNRFPSNR